MQNPNKRWIRLLLILLPALLIFVLTGVRVGLFSRTVDLYKNKTVLITEAVSKNLSGLADAEGDHSGWLELYNASNEEISLAGWGLSNRSGQPYRWVFPDVTLPAHRYLLVYTSGKNDVIKGQLHASFTLSASGSLLTLTDAAGTTVDSLALPKQSWDISYGRSGLDPDADGFFNYATPGRPNPGEFLVRSSLPQPGDTSVQFSAESGFYTDSFELTLSCDDPEAIILYTTDGSAPDIGSRAYTGPITVAPPDRVQWAAVQNTPDYAPYLYRLGTGEIARCRVIRAAIYKKGRLTAPAAQTYFFNISTTLPVVSLNTDPAELFDERNGLYVPGVLNFLLSRQNDRAGNFLRGSSLVGSLEMFDAQGQSQLNAIASFTLAGNASRVYSQQKSFHLQLINDRVSFNAEGKNYILSGFDLRSPRTDEPSYTTYQDAFAENLLLPLNMGAQACTPVQLYLDGEYWGIYYLKETLNDDYILRHYGVAHSELECAKVSDDWEIKYGPKDFLEQIDALYSRLWQSDLSRAEDYAWVQTQFDTDSFATYIAAQTYLNSVDWITRLNNIMLWRSDTVDPENPYADGRWRFATYDLDLIMQHADEDTLATLLDTECAEEDSRWLPLLLFQRLWKNEDFRDLFARRTEELMDTVYAPETMNAAWAAHMDRLRPEMAQELERIKVVPVDSDFSRWWRESVDPELRDPENIPVEDWEIYCNIFGDFANTRPDNMRAFLQAALDREG